MAESRDRTFDRPGPTHGIADHAQHFRLVIGGKALMAGPEIKDASLPADAVTAAGEDAACISGPARRAFRPISSRECGAW